MHPNPLSAFTAPFVLWSRLAWQTGELAMTSAQVIGQRTARPVLSGIEARARYDGPSGRYDVETLRIDGPARQERGKTIEHARQEKCQATRP